MSNEQSTSGTGIAPNAQRLLWAGFMAIFAAGVGFSIRGGILGDWGAQFGFTQGELGAITGGGLTGFGLTIIFFSFFADRVGYGPLMAIAFVLHFLSAVVTLAATPVFNALGKDAAYQCLYWGMFLFALGNGTCESVVNPLTATLFPKAKTHWLNILHAGWPGGLIIGALMGLIFKAVGNIRWEIQMSMFLIPTLIYGLMMFRQHFPHSEARVHGVTIGRMMEEIGLLGAIVVIMLLGLWLASDVCPGLKLPPVLGWAAAGVLVVLVGTTIKFKMGHWVLAFLLVLHAMVGYVELGTDSWITNITGTILADPKKGLMLFIWTSGLMFALRFFAGPIVHKISPLGLLFGAAAIATVGLFMLGNATTGWACIIATTIYGIGKTYYWPTMLGVASERFPKGGALVLGCLGGVGMLSAGLLGGPGIGYKQDYFASNDLKEKSAPAYERYKSDTMKSFLVFPQIAGLDQAKVAALNDGGAQINKDIAALEKSGRKLGDDKNLEKLSQWWETAKTAAANDKGPVNEATLHGGKTALKWTALVPFGMAIGYLLLIGYFKAAGGYKQVHIEGVGKEAKEVP
jgi:MFS family permease